MDVIKGSSDSAPLTGYNRPRGPEILALMLNNRLDRRWVLPSVGIGFRKTQPRSGLGRFSEREILIKSLFPND